MDGAEVFRAARRRQGWTQTELASRSGVARSTVAAVEAGRRPPTLPVLEAVLGAAGLELAVDRPTSPVALEVVRHLRASTAVRLHLALGGDGRPRLRRGPEGWRQLERVAASGRVHLHGELARAVWLPTVVHRPTVCVQQWTTCGREVAPLLRVLPPCGTHVAAPVRVLVAARQVLVDPPGDLALHDEQGRSRLALRAVARLLHEQAPRDAAGRRPRAHRDPDHVAERAHVFHTKRFAQLPLPERDDVRSWRLDDSASKAEWLRRLGYPT